MQAGKHPDSPGWGFLTSVWFTQKHNKNNNTGYLHYSSETYPEGRRQAGGRMNAEVILETRCSASWLILATGKKRENNVILGK